MDILISFRLQSKSTNEKDKRDGTTEAMDLKTVECTKQKSY